MSKCKARQFSDQMFCEECDVGWDMNDLHAPECKKPESKELKPCPFCGESEDLVRDFNGNYHSIFCMDCEAEGPPHDSEEDAVTAWNRRA